MAYENAKRELENNQVRVASTAEGIYDANIVILFWEGVATKYINECIEYLNSSSQSIVSGPTTFDDTSFADDLYHLHAYYDEDSQRIYRLMLPNPVTTQLFTQTDTKWKLMQGERYQAGQSNVIIGMNNVSPSYALTFQEAALDDSYTDLIYLLRGELLDGEWFSIKREAVEDSRTGMYTVRWYLSRYLNNEVGFSYKDDFNSIVTEINLIEANFGLIRDFMAGTLVAPDGHWYNDTGAGTYDKKDGVDVDPPVAMPADAVSLETQVEGRQVRIRSFYDEREKNWNIQLLVSHQSEEARLFRQTEGDIDSRRISHKTSPTTTIVIEHGLGITEAELRRVNAYYSACDTGTVRRIDIREEAGGLYSFMATEVLKTGVAYSFSIGSDTIYIGESYDKRPTTDIDAFNADNPEAVGTTPVSDNYYLIGANWTGAAWECLLTGDSVISPSISRNEDGTFSWNIRWSTETEDEYGDPDPDGFESSSFLFEYGEPNNVTRWLGRYQMEAIVGGQISLIGAYRDIPANEFGTHPLLKGRRIVSKIIRNERIKDGKISYDVYENIVTADINDDDDWFYVGCTESADRIKSSLGAEYVFAGGASTPSGYVNLAYLFSEITGGAPSFAADFLQLQSACKRRRTVMRYRKYFIRRPTTADLENCLDSGTTTIKEAMDAVANVETQNEADVNTLEVATYDVVKLGNQLWAIEKLVVSKDDKFYIDEDAFDRLHDSAGDSIVRHQIIDVDIANVPGSES